MKPFNLKTNKRLIKIFYFLINCAFALTISLNGQDTIYIDPSTSSLTQDGSEANPYASLNMVTFDVGNTYLIKRGTTLNSEGISIASDSILIGAYGDSDLPRPKLIFTNSGKAINIEGVELKIQSLEVIAGNPDIMSEVISIRGRSSTSLTRHAIIDDCYLQGGWHTIGASNYTRLEITRCNITKMVYDAMYLSYNDTIVIRNTNVYNGARLFENQTNSDCIHTESSAQIYLDSVYSNHASFPGKFALITNGYDSVSVKNSTFMGNPSNAAVYIGGGPDFYMENCKVIGGDIGLWDFVNTLVVKNSVFINQLSNSIFQGGDKYIYNCAFVNIGASAIRDWAIDTSGNHKIEVKNCIYYNTVAYQALYDRVDKYTINENNCYYSTSGTLHTFGSNPLTVDPLFRDFDGNDFRLKAGSPCIDKGINGNGVPDFDFLNVKRPQGLACDIGAYEYSTATEAIIPDAPTNLQASNLTNTGFLLSWISSTDINVIAYDVFIDGKVLASVKIPALSVDVTGLECGVDYDITVRARNSAGSTSLSSDTLIVTTLGDTENPSIPINLSASDITYNSFTLTWNASSDNVLIEEYLIYLNGVFLPVDSLKKAPFTLSLNENNVITATIIKGIEAGTTYSVTVRAKDASGNVSAESGAILVTTPSYPVINNSNYANTFYFYPNPAHDNLIIESETTANLKILSLEGKVMLDQLINSGNTGISIVLKPGIYILQLTDDANKIIRSKIIVY